MSFAAVALGWRVWLQWRRTGDSGLRRTSRTKPEILAGLGLLPGVVAIAATPILDLTGALAPIESMARWPVRAAGIACFVTGFVLTVRAQLDMGASWRIGVDQTETTELVTDGVFRYVRNPIFTGMVLTFAGTSLLVPNLAALIGVVLIVVGLELHVRLVEEPYLARVHGEVYRTYARTAGRFVPGLGRAT